MERIISQYQKDKIKADLYNAYYEAHKELFFRSRSTYWEECIPEVENKYWAIVRGEYTDEGIKGLENKVESSLIQPDTKVKKHWFDRWKKKKA